MPGIVRILALTVFDANFSEYWFKKSLPKLETAKRRNRAPSSSENAAYYMKMFDTLDDAPANPDHVVKRILEDDDDTDFFNFLR